MLRDRKPNVLAPLPSAVDETLVAALRAQLAPPELSPAEKVAFAERLEARIGAAKLRRSRSVLSLGFAGAAVAASLALVWMRVDGSLPRSTSPDGRHAAAVQASAAGRGADLLAVLVDAENGVFDSALGGGSDSGGWSNEARAGLVDDSALWRVAADGGLASHLSGEYRALGMFVAVAEP